MSEFFMALMQNGGIKLSLTFFSCFVTSATKSCCNLKCGIWNMDRSEIMVCQLCGMIILYNSDEANTDLCLESNLHKNEPNIYPINY